MLEALSESFGKAQARVPSSVAGVIRAWRRTGDGDDGLGALDVVNCLNCAAVEAWKMGGV
jgi:hypothetical protein